MLMFNCNFLSMICQTKSKSLIVVNLDVFLFSFSNTSFSAGLFMQDDANAYTTLDQTPTLSSNPNVYFQRSQAHLY